MDQNILLWWTYGVRPKYDFCPKSVVIRRDGIFFRRSTCFTLDRVDLYCELYSIPAVAAASVSHSAAVGGSVVGVVGLL